MHKIDQHTFKISKTGRGFKIWSPEDNIPWKNPTVVVLCSIRLEQSFDEEVQPEENNKGAMLMNIRISKAFRTTSNEALCVLKGLGPIMIELQEIVKKYKLERNRDVNVGTSLELKK